MEILNGLHKNFLIFFISSPKKLVQIRTTGKNHYNKNWNWNTEIINAYEFTEIVGSWSWPCTISSLIRNFENRTFIVFVVFTVHAVLHRSGACVCISMCGMYYYCMSVSIVISDIIKSNKTKQELFLFFWFWIFFSFPHNLIEFWQIFRYIESYSTFFSFIFHFYVDSLVPEWFCNIQYGRWHTKRNSFVGRSEGKFTFVVPVCSNGVPRTSRHFILSPYFRNSNAST